MRLLVAVAVAALAAASAVHAGRSQTPPTAEHPRHWPDGQLRWGQMPIPSVPRGEKTTVQAEITCTVARQGRVRDCRIDREGPRGTRFGRVVLGSLARARLRQERAAPGDTLTIVLWACPVGVQPCELQPWPEA